MATIFWDSRGVVLIDYLGKSKTINRNYYTALLEKLNDIIKIKRPYLAKNTITQPLTFL